MGIEISHVILMAIVFVGLSALYFMPTIVAVRRKHRNAVPIFVINLFFGWTLIAWVLLLAWSLSGAGQPASR